MANSPKSRSYIDPGYLHVGLALCDLAAALRAAAAGQPERERCVLRLELTWPRPLHPGVGHFKIVSCNANTVHIRS